MTPETVNATLDEVRPYLIADGGNVEVAGVEDGTVYLRLQVSLFACKGRQCITHYTAGCEALVKDLRVVPIACKILLSDQQDWV